MLMYIGGTQITPFATYAPSRIDEPPGTTRTPMAVLIFLSGSVSLSPKNQRPPSIDTSSRSPHRNPTRIPCFTHVLTRQPVGADASGSAARTRPADISSRSFAKTDRLSLLSAAAPC